MNEIFRIEIPNYITHVQLSKARRKKYYKKGNKIPKKYQNAQFGYNKLGILIENKSSLPIVANPRTAGTPRFKKINGQEIYTGNLPPMLRSIMIKEMKTYYRSQITKKIKILKPCKLVIDIHNAIGAGNQDLDNMSWLLVKVIQDVLVELRILPEDNVTVIKGYEVNFVPIDEKEQRKLTVKLLIDGN